MDLLSRVEKKRRAARTAMLGSIILLCLALVLFLQSGFSRAWVIVIIMAICLFQLIVVRGMRQRFKKECMRASALINAEELGNPEYAYTEATPGNPLVQADMLPGENLTVHSLRRHIVRGRLGQKPVELCELACSYRPAGKGVKPYSAASGVLISMTLDGSTDDLLLMSDNLFPTAFLDDDYQKLGLVSVPFPEQIPDHNCRLFLPEGCDAASLSPMLWKWWKRLSDGLSAPVGIRIRDGHATFFLRGRFYAYDIPISQPPTREALGARRLAELSLLMKLGTVYNPVAAARANEV